MAVASLLSGLMSSGPLSPAMLGPSPPGARLLRPSGWPGPCRIWKQTPGRPCAGAGSGHCLSREDKQGEQNGHNEDNTLHSRRVFVPLVARLALQLLRRSSPMPRGRCHEELAGNRATGRKICMSACQSFGFIPLSSLFALTMSRASRQATRKSRPVIVPPQI